MNFEAVNGALNEYFRLIAAFGGGCYLCYWKTGAVELHYCLL